MQTATMPVRNQAGRDPGQDPTTSLMSIVAGMMSLIIRVQVSARLIEVESQRDCGGADGNETTDVVILDDVTPCYTTASETLSVCNAGLDAALQALLGTLSEAKQSAPPQAGSSHKSA